MIYNEIFLAAKLTHAVLNKNTFAEKTVLVIEGKYPDLHFYYFIREASRCFPLKQDSF